MSVRPVSLIISGGQTGIDRAAIDAAIAVGIPYDGWIPRGRKAEDGEVPKRYMLREHESADFPARTRANVELADAVIVIADSLGPGSRLTLRLTGEALKPAQHIRAHSPDIGKRIAEFIRAASRAYERPIKLMIAGTRGSRLGPPPSGTWAAQIENGLRVWRS